MAVTGKNGYTAGAISRYDLPRMNHGSNTSQAPPAISSGCIRLSIVYLNFQRLAETRQTTERLKALTAGRRDIEVIAVDNASRDGTGEYLTTQQDWLLPILLERNDGIAGYNIGFAKSRGDYVFVLDDDSCPMDEATLDRAIALLDENPSIGVVASDIFNADGSRQWSWHLPVAQDFAEAMAFVGCGFAIRRALFAQIGWYPAEFFLYQNELEVAFRVHLAGYRIVFEPRCRVVHRGDPQTRPGQRRVFYATRNTLWLLRRYARAPKRAYLIGSRLLIGLLNAARFGQLAAYARAVRAGLSEPIPRRELPANIHALFLPFWRQNSVFHQFISRLS
jgi:GT2 family glycosyltransferase